ncbi:MAG: polyphosphate polymerase domain-containing protein, partial [Planctomycetaceae bacterium]
MVSENELQKLPEVIEPPKAEFRIVEDDVVRTDLASRREVKYVFPCGDVAKLRGLLNGSGRRLVHNKPVSTVRSIYFDDVQLSACRANIDGVSRRKKVRLRWYDSLVPDQNLFFEIKWRNNRITGKHRLQLQAQQPIAGLPYRQIVDELLGVLPAPYAGDLLASNEPILIVEYKREHFESREANLRATLDYDLAFYDQTGKRNISTSFPHRLHDM